MESGNSTSSGGWLEKITPYILLVLSIAALAGAVLRVTASGKPLLECLDNTTGLYLVLSAGLLLLQKMKTLSFGDLKMELEQVRQIAETARDSAKVADDAARYGVTGIKENQSVEAKAISSEIVKGNVHDDPWKGVFGGKGEQGTRKLSALVNAIPGSKDWFFVDLCVESISPKRDRLQGQVQFFLHDTFANDRPVVPVGPDGTAKLHLKAYGAFTVGVLADNGKTKLELDLSELQEAPRKFRIS